MTFAVPMVSTDESIYKEHWEKVCKRLKTIGEQLKRIAHLVTWSIGSIFILILVVITLNEDNLETKKIGELVLDIVLIALPGFLIGVLVRKPLEKLFLKTIWYWVSKHTQSSRISTLFEVAPSNERDEYTAEKSGRQARK